MKRLLITIDTEMDADIHWNKSFPPKFESVIYGIPDLLRPIWDKYNVTPIYFVSPEVARNNECCKVLKSEISKGAIIGAHLHADFIEPDIRDSVLREKFPCIDCDYETEYQKIKNLTELIENKLGVKPIWYRAARFGADEDTIRILKQLQYKYDSSFTPGIDWSKKGGPNHKGVNNGRYDVSGIVEYPVTIMGRRFGILGRVLPDNWLFYKWLRPTHMLVCEMKSIIKEASINNVDDLVMMFHSMEPIINKTPYVRNKLMQSLFLRRLEKSIGYAIKMNYDPNIKG